MGTAFYETPSGSIVQGDSLAVVPGRLQADSVDLVMTSPPFGLVHKKEYGNVAAHDYLDWFKPFGAEFHRILKDTGSLVIDIGGAWIRGQPTRSLYHFELMIMLCREFGFHLAQEFYWWNPSKLPSPAEWVTVRRIRTKDAVNCVWWLSKSPWPKASNRRVLTPYSDSMNDLFRNGYHAALRPSGHDISDKFGRNNGAAIPPNLLAIPNTDSNSTYLQHCKQRGIKPHPARFPSALPEFFMRMLTDVGDMVVDPFAGSCVTGEVAEKLQRRWLCIELDAEYLEGAIGRFPVTKQNRKEGERSAYKISHPASLWDGIDDEPLPADGGQERRLVGGDRSKARRVKNAWIRP